MEPARRRSVVRLRSGGDASVINLTTLYADGRSTSDALRYGRGSGAPHSAAGRRPVVVWNATRRCNLACRHCYSDSRDREYLGELTTAEAQRFIRDLAAFRVPALLFSGGEPLVRPDIFELLSFARSLGLKVTVSTNGTLITSEVAARLRSAGVTYVGVSLDGMRATHDRFRGSRGAFDRTREGIRALRAAGVRTGLRLTLAKQTIDELDELFSFAEREGIARICFYHLVPVGRGRESDLLPPEKTRHGIDRILLQVRELARCGSPIEILTVDGHFDGPYTHLRLRERDRGRAEEVLQRLRWNGGALNSTGVGIACVDWEGNVYPDQFLRSSPVGSVRERSFSTIWSDSTQPRLAALRDKRSFLHGRCTGCRFLDACGGGLRARALAVTGDLWASDPACYLTSAESGA
ncbi:MAG: radical SAM protein [Actinomycetota bacterium]